MIGRAVLGVHTGAVMRDCLSRQCVEISPVWRHPCDIYAEVNGCHVTSGTGLLYWAELVGRELIRQELTQPELMQSKRMQPADPDTCVGKEGII